MHKPLIYLASPHSHPKVEVREERYREALKCQNWLVSNGFWVFSPIVSSHYTTETLKYLDFSFWKEFDTEMITRCDELWVLIIDGTENSIGVKAEFEIAKLQGKKIHAIWPRDKGNDFVLGSYELGENFLGWPKENAQTS